ncbi:hypothetical protein N183_24245 [Sinorhizobium sp. Sb3]|nr:hypothetical protein N183_24245 [Sinorhizobium sp. Sb3]
MPKPLSRALFSAWPYSTSLIGWAAGKYRNIASAIPAFTIASPDIDVAEKALAD